MTVSYTASGAIAYSTASGSSVGPVALPAHLLDDLLVLVVGSKPDTMAIGIPPGWNWMGTVAGGAGTTGADTGPTTLTFFTKPANSAAETAPTVALFGNNITWAQVHGARKTGGAWDVMFVGGADATTGTPHSVVMPYDIGMTAGDLMIVAGCVPTDVTTPAQFSSETVAASGMTTVNLTEISEPDSTLGNDIGGWIAYGSVVTGTSSGAATVSAVAAATNTNISGPIALVRIREATATPIAGTDTASLTITESNTIIQMVGAVGQHVLQANPTSMTVSPPAGSQATDIEIIFVGNKLSTSPPTDLAFPWFKVVQGIVGTGSDAEGTGPILLTAWARELTGAAGSTNVLIPSGNVAVAGGAIYRKPSGYTWEITGSLGTDSSSGTAFSATMADNLLAEIGDYVLSVGVFTLATSLPGRGMLIPGATFTRTGINSTSQSTGNDLYLYTDHAIITDGLQNAASSTTGTAGLATTGGALNIRIHAEPPATDIPIDGTDTSSVAIDESSTLFVTLTSTDSAAMTISESRVQDVSLSTVDTGSIAISEARTQDVLVSRADTGSLTISETTATTAGITGTDAASVAITESRTQDVSLSRSDAAALSIAESVLQDVALSRADTSGLSIADMSTLVAIIIGSDTSALTITEAVTQDVALTRTDTSGLSIAESSAPLVFLTRSDTGALTITEAMTLKVFLDAIDSGVIEIQEVSSTLVQVTDIDTSALSISDVSFFGDQGVLRVYIDGEWKTGILRIYIGGEWKIVQIKFRKDGTWL